MKCVVTGCAGFIGSHLTERLLNDGHEVVGVDSFLDYYPRAIKEKNLQVARDHRAFNFVEGNLAKLDLLPILEGASWIFHQAAQAGVRASWGKSFDLYLESNIQATQRLLEAAKDRAVRNSLKKIVYASSSSVYGNAETYPTTEKMKPQPVSPYGVTKLSAEHLMSLYTTEFGVPTASLRYFTVYGPRQRPDMAFHKFIKAGLQNQALTIYGDGEQTRDFTFISDAIQANLSAAQAQSSALVFNIGGGSRVSVKKVLSVLEELIGRKLNLSFQETQAGDARHTAADISLAQREIGYQPKVSLEQGLSEELAWLKTSGLV
ncbi:GDP-mannose 4,6-dehydratase [bacterium]|nr:GDP-mannose 4,6-dehydratase [bacterium]